MFTFTPSTVSVLISVRVIRPGILQIYSFSGLWDTIGYIWISCFDGFFFVLTRLTQRLQTKKRPCSSPSRVQALTMPFQSPSFQVQQREGDDGPNWCEGWKIIGTCGYDMHPRLCIPCASPMSHLLLDAGRYKPTAEVINHTYLYMDQSMGHRTLSCSYCGWTNNCTS